MPHKHNAARRHRIPRPRYKVTNWSAYEAGLCQRGSLTIRFTQEAIEAWRAAPRSTPGGQARYSDLAIETTLILKAVFYQPLRQTEGLVRSLLELMGLDLLVPDHSTLSRRAASLAVVPTARTAKGRFRQGSRQVAESLAIPQISPLSEEETDALPTLPIGEHDRAFGPDGAWLSAVPLPHVQAWVQ